VRTRIGYTMETGAHKQPIPLIDVIL